MKKPDFSYQHILRFMDLLEEHYDDYLAWLYKTERHDRKKGFLRSLL